MVYTLAFLFLCISGHGEGRSFIPRHFADDIRMDTQSVQQELQEALHEVQQELQDGWRGALGHGHGTDRKQISAANATLLPIFKSLPKNEYGRIGAPAMRYAVQRYFSTNHGWIIKGFEAHNNAHHPQDTGILANKVPGYVEAVLEQMLQKGGFSLPDILTVVVVVERLIFDEVARSVEIAYRLNHHHTEDLLDKNALIDVLDSHMIVEMMERHEFDEELHKEDRQEIHELYANWDGLQEFVKDIVATETSAVLSSGSQNPFSKTGSEVFSFDDAVRIAQRIGNEYGRWGNQECLELRSFLSDMDKKETGRVSLSAFYQAPDDKWSFHEPPEYLRELGALDESSKSLGPQVIISNYVYGMSNCLSSTPYYSVCCLNECEGLLQQIEIQVAKPSATPAEILDDMMRIKIADFAVNVSSKLQTRLEDIAAQGNGKVPLHGRLFAQWLHYVFPRECPFPHASGSLKPQTQGERLSKDKAIAIEAEERSGHIQPKVQRVTLSKNVEVEASEDELWSWDEELMHGVDAAELLGPSTTNHHVSGGFRLWPGIVAAGILVAVKHLHTVTTAAAKNRMLLPMTMKTLKSHDL